VGRRHRVTRIQVRVVEPAHPSKEEETA
jgi:hypothetical protein